MATLQNVRGMRLLHRFTPRGAVPDDMPWGALTEDPLQMVGAVFEQFPADEKAAAKGLRITLDHLANTAGLPESSFFDASGEYTLA